ncbi:sigma-70 family RNA polymerase sigma factor [Pseudomonas sp. S 311-6]|uniref:RNA polymerase sigma factor n=1 Tax=Kerstersia gyiorum TaxID=206506 RepID=A0A171KNI1_9BURK|nr:sigma-70 family RNA polymerase sigma factor [Kerstersia gyiorum]AZV92844.1 RNA polymerase subunit sigma [Bordetella sp. J329]MCO7643607.1 sigma-70 family RNA polymerase sigma factor [Pseudomonas sp. S 311-6]KAB0544619.1 sigma-70 family RNA polymerase sigma factor [Kerstersia gyiorum]KKO70448.1 RNA polymerase sigma factor [Kerstersia gyiorum]MCP1633450.1 RNA polymerase sigma-70 factor (ECF subfamily) [Kerstersia gyiorum]
MIPGSTAGKDALQALYASHYGWLVGWLKRRVESPMDAADFAQDTFVRLLARERPLDQDREPRALLAHIAKALLVDHWRHRAVEQAFLDALMAQPEPLVSSPEEIALVREALMRIDAMLASMPEKTRVIFLLSRIDGLKYAEIGERLGMAEITVKRHMRRAWIACLELA